MKIIQQTNMNSKQMMGYAVQAKTGEVLYIDGGYSGNGDEIKRIVKALGGHIDLWLITHPHCDHHNAIMEVLKNPDGITYDKIGASQVDDNWVGLKSARDGKEVIEWNAFARENLDERYFDVKKGQVFNLGSMKIEVLAEKNPEIIENPINNQSAVFRITEDGFTFIVLGDLGIEAGEKLMNSGVDLKADAVQMAHHGQQGVTEEFYKKVQPTYCFWATPDWLWYNYNYLGNGEPFKGPFKTQETAEWMKKLNTVNILNFEHTVVFDSETKEVKDF